MALTSSGPVELGWLAADFALPDPRTGNVRRMTDYARSHVLLVAFICAHCPYVIHVQPELRRLHADFDDESFALIGISSNDAEAYPADRPEKLAQLSEKLGFPVLYDESQAVARAYQAVCTPDFFLFDRSRKLVYRGQLDDSRPGNQQPLDGKDLRAAILATLAGHPVKLQHQRASVGCSIKWKH